MHLRMINNRWPKTPMEIDSTMNEKLIMNEQCSLHKCLTEIDST